MLLRLQLNLFCCLPFRHLPPLSSFRSCPYHSRVASSSVRLHLPCLFAPTIQRHQRRRRTHHHDHPDFLPRYGLNHYQDHTLSRSHTLAITTPEKYRQHPILRSCPFLAEYVPSDFSPSLSLGLSPTPAIWAAAMTKSKPPPLSSPLWR